MRVKDRKIMTLKIVFDLVKEVIALAARKVDASAWTRKYFRMDSEFRGEDKWSERARNARRLTSRPIHAISQEEADIAISEPKINKIVKNNFQGRISIKRRRNP